MRAQMVLPEVNIFRVMKNKSAAKCFTMLHMSKAISPPKSPPRVSVPVTAEVLAIFERLAKVGNMSTSRAIAEWLSDTIEAAELMASTMERARAAPKIVTAELEAMMLGMADYTKAMNDKIASFKNGPAGKRAACGGTTEADRLTAGPSANRFSASNPPPCNTGGKLPKTKKTNLDKSPSFILVSPMEQAKLDVKKAISPKVRK